MPLMEPPASQPLGEVAVPLLLSAALPSAWRSCVAMSYRVP
jgi:hypothetical protein